MTNTRPNKIIDDDKLRELRKAKPCAKLEELAREFGVTREAVRVRLNKLGLSTRHYIIRYNCYRCGKQLNHVNKSGYCPECRHDSCHLPLVCDNPDCGKLFYRRKSVIMVHEKRPGIYKGHYYCSRYCAHHTIAINMGLGRKHRKHLSVDSVHIRWLTRLGFTPLEIRNYTGFTSAKVNGVWRYYSR